MTQDFLHPEASDTRLGDSKPFQNFTEKSTFTHLCPSPDLSKFDSSDCRHFSPCLHFVEMKATQTLELRGQTIVGCLHQVAICLLHEVIVEGQAESVPREQRNRPDRREDRRWIVCAAQKPHDHSIDRAVSRGTRKPSPLIT